MLEKLASELDIHRVLNRYCQLIDAQDFDHLGQLFADEGELDITGTPVTGPHAIATFMGERAKARSMHVPSGYVVTFVSDDEAVVTSQVLVFRGVPGVNPPYVMTLPGAAATYQDRMVRRSGQWQILRRRAQPFMIAG